MVMGKMIHLWGDNWLFTSLTFNPVLPSSFFWPDDINVLILSTGTTPTSPHGDGQNNTLTSADNFTKLSNSNHDLNWSNEDQELNDLSKKIDELSTYSDESDEKEKMAEDPVAPSDEGEGHWMIDTCHWPIEMIL